MKNLRLWIFVGIIVLLFILNHIFGWSQSITPEMLTAELQRAVHESPVQASLLYIVVSMVSSCVLALPGIVFALVAGAVFGPVWGTLLCWGSMSVGAILSFLAGRYFLRDALRPKLAKNKLLNRYLFEGSQKSDVFLLAVTRLVPVFPFNLQNFAYGITDISLSHYTLYTTLFIFPGTMAYTVAAAGVADASVRTVSLIVAVLTIAATLLIARYLRQKAGIEQ